MALEKLDLCGLSICAVMVIEPEFTAGDAFRVLQKFHHASFIFGGFCFDVLRMDAVCGVDKRVFFAEFSGAVEIRWVAGHMDERLGTFDSCCGRFFFGGT